MTIDRFADRVTTTLARLRDDYGEFPTREQEWHVSAETYESARERAEHGTVGGAGAWVVRDRDGDAEALFVRESDADGWSEPAGKQEPGESLETTARREVREETGVEVAVEGVRLATRAIHTHTDRPGLHRLVVVFDARQIGGETRPEPDEIDAVAWRREHPEDLRYSAVADFPISVEQS
ncbi:MAG: NUDIX domain-containing protein [Halobaculum sp.]